jgi:hypothetical protein
MKKPIYLLIFTSLLILGACEKKDILSDEEKQVLGTWQMLDYVVSGLENTEVKSSVVCLNKGLASFISTGIPLNKYTFYNDKKGVYFEPDKQVNYNFSWSYDRIYKTWDVYLLDGLGVEATFSFHLDKPNIGFFELNKENAIPKCTLQNNIPMHELDNHGNVVYLSTKVKPIVRFNKINP